MCKIHSSLGRAHTNTLALKLSNRSSTTRFNINYIKNIQVLEKDFILIDFEIRKFYDRLIAYWKRIDFLNTIKISESDLI